MSFFIHARSSVYLDARIPRIGFMVELLTMARYLLRRYSNDTGAVGTWPNSRDWGLVSVETLGHSNRNETTLV